MYNVLRYIVQLTVSGFVFLVRVHRTTRGKRYITLKTESGTVKTESGLFCMWDQVPIRTLNTCGHWGLSIQFGTDGHLTPVYEHVYIYLIQIAVWGHSSLIVDVFVPVVNTYTPVLRNA